ncbi:MAG: hypothetical protein PHW07_01855 [Sulfurospirillaceae bacterium]|nr:hypothetical protein [Sulfurospirillaceae bacterium]
MKRLTQAILISIFLLLGSGCQKSLEAPQVPVVDPSLPKIDSVKTLSDITEIGFEWTPSYAERVSGYYIYRASDSGKMEKIASIKDKYASHYVDTKLKPATQYNYRFVIFSEDKRESEPSPIVTASTNEMFPSVSYVKAIVGLPQRVKVVWRPHSYDRVESYIIERNDLRSTDWKEVGTIDGRLNAEYIDAGLKDNYVYRYRVRVKTYDGLISKPSEIVEANTKPLPKEVEGLKATSGQPKKIVLTWEPSSEQDLVYYKVYRSSSSLLSFYDYHAKTKSTQFEDLVNDNGSTFYYKVTAVDKDGLESLKQKAPATGSTLSAPNSPVPFSIKHDGSSIMLTWSATDNRAVKYNIIREGGKKQTFTGISQRSFHDQDVSVGIAYKYSIIAIDEYGLASKPSESFSITIPKD